MTDSNRATANEQWTSVHSYILAAICLLAGIVGGWLIRGLQIPRDTSSQPATASVPAGMPGMPASQVPTPAQMQHMADTQVAPLLEKLKSDPNNVDLLANIGNVYYDAQLFPSAIEYYQRALKIQPSNTSIRTDMATAYWYVGKADDAIAEFNKSLSYEPTKPNTLLNLGIVQWQGKMDINAAMATWKKLLDTNPNYEGKDKVMELMAQAQQHLASKPAGTSSK